MTSKEVLTNYRNTSANCVCNYVGTTKLSQTKNTAPKFGEI